QRSKAGRERGVAYARRVEDERAVVARAVAIDVAGDERSERKSARSPDEGRDHRFLEEVGRLHNDLVMRRDARPVDRARIARVLWSKPRAWLRVSKYVYATVSCPTENG